LWLLERWLAGYDAGQLAAGWLTAWLGGWLSIYLAGWLAVYLAGWLTSC
jgi:hypothetical protein